jgi:hypothetical protein
LKSKYKNILFVLTIIAIAYLPIWSFIFSLKNDFFTQYFLQRFFIGESIKAGVFPLWNPYINYGLPVYNDMNGGFWYPATWINGIITGYNAYSFTIEEALHFPLAGFGMYLLSSYYKLGQPVKMIAAISYACCGYFVAHTQHYNWITGAAWLPWCLLALFRYLDSPIKTNLAFVGLVFSFFISGSHPGLIIGGIYFFSIMAAFKIKENGHWMQAWKKLLALLAVIILCVTGLIYSYTEIIPLFTRSGKISTGMIMGNSTSPVSFLSFLLPFPFTRTAPETAEISMNNMYLGLLILISVLTGILKNRNVFNMYLLATSIFFFLLSTNLAISVFLVENLPMLKYVRLNGEMRIFGMLPLLIFGSIQLNHFLLHDRKSLVLVALIFSLCTLPVILVTMSIHSGIIKLISGLPGILANGGTRESLKTYIHSISFMDATIIQLIIQFFFLLFFAISIRRKPSFIVWIAAADIITATLLNLPFTGVSMRPTSEIQLILDHSPKGFPNPSIIPEADIYQNYPVTDTLTGNWSIYGKQIAIDKQVQYPIILKNSKLYFDSLHQLLKSKKNPYVYSLNENAELKTVKFSPGLFSFNVNSKQNDYLVIKQNLYPGWIATVNDKKTIPDTVFYTFPEIGIQKGSNLVNYEFRKTPIIWLFAGYWVLLFSLTIVIIASGTFFRNRS